ncbi:atherin [Passer domesticus]|uniref:atherin n=1 Tax=Passer domesticus TaxID=48849 RepID=UPI0030FE7C83
MKIIKVAVYGAPLAAARRLLVAPTKDSSGQPPLAPLPQQGLPEQQEALGGCFPAEEQPPPQKRLHRRCPVSTRCLQSHLQRAGAQRPPLRNAPAGRLCGARLGAERRQPRALPRRFAANRSTAAPLQLAGIHTTPSPAVLAVHRGCIPAESWRGAGRWGLPPPSHGDAAGPVPERAGRSAQERREELRDPALCPALRSAPRPPRRSAPAPLRSSPLPAASLRRESRPPARPPGPASRSRPPAGSPGDSARLPPQEAPQPPRRLPLGARLWQFRFF